jgi:hypothetical protein
MSGSLSTQQITDGDLWKVTDALPRAFWFWQDADRRVFFARLVRRCGKQPTLPRSKLFSSVEDNTCRRITLILLSFHAKCPFFLKKSLTHRRSVLSWSSVGTTAYLCCCLFSIAGHNDRKQWKFAFINADIEGSASEWWATMLRPHNLRHFNPTLYISLNQHNASMFSVCPQSYPSEASH